MSSGSPLGRALARPMRSVWRSGDFAASVEGEDGPNNAPSRDDRWGNSARYLCPS